VLSDDGEEPEGERFHEQRLDGFRGGAQVGGATRFPLLTLSTQDGGTLTHTPNGAKCAGDGSAVADFREDVPGGNAAAMEKEMARLRRGESVLDKMGARFASPEKGAQRARPEAGVDYTTRCAIWKSNWHADEAWVTRPKPVVNEPAPSDGVDRADNVGGCGISSVDTACATDRLDARRLDLVRGMDLKAADCRVNEDHHGLSHHGRNPAKIEQLRIIENAEMTAFRDFSRRRCKTPGGRKTCSTRKSRKAVISAFSMMRSCSILRDCAP